MEWTKTKPTEPGFYWCKPSFGHAMYYDSDNSLPKDPTISICQVIAMKRIDCGTLLHVRFLGHKIPHSLNSPVIENTLWGERISNN